MQLPAMEQLVLVSGLPPIRARKARYFEDLRLKNRIMPPPAVSASANSHADPWSALPIPVLPEIDINRSEGLLDDTDNGGIRREPTLPGHEAIEPEPATTAREFAMLEDDSDDDTARARVLLRGTSSSIARQVAMDPGDGMDL